MPIDNTSRRDDGPDPLLLRMLLQGPRDFPIAVEGFGGMRRPPSQMAVPRLPWQSPLLPPRPLPPITTSLDFATPTGR